MSVDWDSLQEELQEHLGDIASVVLDRAKADVQEYGKRIARLMISAVREGRDDLRQELLDASKMVLELQRIRATNQQMRILETVLNTTFRWLLRVATGVGL